jgi:chromate transporter
MDLTWRDQDRAGVPADRPRPRKAPVALSRHDVGISRIFLAFLLIGGTSVGGGIVGHLRSSLVVRHQWIDDRTFLELLAISQSLPGLNAANMAILVGDRLSGVAGAIAALAGMCLPGAILMYIVGVVYNTVGQERPLLNAALQGVTPAAVGLLLATTLKLGRRSLSGVADLVFLAITVVCVNGLHMSVPRVLLIVGGLAVAWYGFRGAVKRRERERR